MSLSICLFKFVSAKNLYIYIYIYIPVDWALGQGTAGCHIRVNSKCFSRIECSYSRLPTYEYISKKSLRLRWNRWYSWYLTFEISGWLYVSLVSIPSRLSSYTEELWYDKTDMSLSICLFKFVSAKNLYIYIYIYQWIEHSGKGLPAATYA